MNVNSVVRGVGDVVGYVVAGVLSRGLDVLAPLPKRQPLPLDTADDAAVDEGLPSFYGYPRVVDGRGLGESERDAEWVDKAGDLWRWNRKLGSWQNKMRQPNICTTWYAVPTEDDTTSAIYAPYTEYDGLECDEASHEALRALRARPESPSAVVVAAPASGPPAEVKVPGADPEAPAPGTPNSTDEERFKLLPGDGGGVARDIAFYLEAGDVQRARHQLNRLIEMLGREPDAKPPTGTPSRVNPDAAPVLRDAAVALRAWTTGQRMLDELLPYWRNVAHCLDIYADECDAHQIKHAL